MNPDDRRFLARAIELAIASVSAGGGPFGAVVVRHGQVIAEGQNAVTTSCDPTAHAEIVAIRAACTTLHSHQLGGCTVYASCEPCPMCLGAIYWARPDRLVFAAGRDVAARAGFDDGLIYDEIPRPVQERRLPTGQISHPDQDRPFDAWKDHGDRIDY